MWISLFFLAGLACLFACLLCHFAYLRGVNKTTIWFMARFNPHLVPFHQPWPPGQDVEYPEREGEPEAEEPAPEKEESVPETGADWDFGMPGKNPYQSPSITTGGLLG